MRLPDNRKALDGLWELSIIVPLAAFSRHAMLGQSAHLRPFGYAQGDSGVGGGPRIGVRCRPFGCVWDKVMPALC